MTVLHKVGVLEQPRHAGGTVKVARALGGAAPALFKLLADSALNRAALDVCGAPLAIVDARTSSQTVTYANPAFESLFGFSTNEASGCSLFSALAAVQESALRDWLPWGGERTRVEFDTAGKDGSQLRVEAVAGDVRGSRGERTHWVLTFIASGGR